MKGKMSNNMPPSFPPPRPAAPSAHHVYADRHLYAAVPHELQRTKET
ncbi:hypothetical protein E2C01_066786 [Portunus trituberculatus]|uniref:Uncharacterized protein n=1 Tax=Portunus trituberculatus TaxID=210409 RepID=A0A5B7HUS8_PORTR|nr:hypothetical protein [Portunus trituberculatus]